LWPLTNSVLINQHFATMADLEEVQLARCAELQRHSLPSSARPPVKTGGRDRSINDDDQGGDSLRFINSASEPRN
jgi:hypothetical protein